MTEFYIGDRVKIVASSGVHESWAGKLGTVVANQDYNWIQDDDISVDLDINVNLVLKAHNLVKLVPDIEAYHIGDNVEVVMRHIRGRVAIDGNIDLTLTLDNGEYFSIAKSDIHSLKVTEAGAKPPVWANGHSIRLSLTMAVYTRDSLTNADAPWYQVGGQVSHSITDDKVDELFRKGSVKIIGKPA